METDNILNYVTLAISVASLVLGVINHKKLVSRCCGRKVEVSLDIGQTSPLLASSQSESLRPPNS